MKARDLLMMALDILIDFNMVLIENNVGISDGTLKKVDKFYECVKDYTKVTVQDLLAEFAEEEINRKLEEASDEEGIRFSIVDNRRE
jgi:hypothetical protein